MDRGKTVGCGAFMIVFALVECTLLGTGVSMAFAPLGFILLVVGFCMNAKPKVVYPHHHRRLPHHR